VLHPELAGVEFLGVDQRVAQLQQVDPEYPDAVQLGEDGLHLAQRAWQNGHFDHHGRDGLRGEGDAIEDVAARGLWVVHAYAEPDFLETRGLQLAQGRLIDVVAARVQPFVGVRKLLAGPLEEGDGLVLVQQRLAAGQGEIVHLLALRVDRVQLTDQIALVRGEMLVIHLVRVEAVITVAVAAQRYEKGGAADPLAAGDAGRGDRVDVDAAVAVADRRAFRLQLAAFFRGQLAEIVRVDGDARRAELVHELLVNAQIKRGIRRENRVFDLGMSVGCNGDDHVSFFRLSAGG